MNECGESAKDYAKGFESGERRAPQERKRTLSEGRIPEYGSYDVKIEYTSPTSPAKSP